MDRDVLAPEDMVSDGHNLRSVTAPNRFQILAIDGGGLKGIFAAAVLAAFEDLLGHPLTDHFDLITGTSTGGIIALGLGAGMTPRQLVDFYAERGPEIFPRASEWSKALRQIVRSKYTNVALEQSLKHVFGSLTLGDASKRLVVPSFNLDADEVYVFKTPHHARLRRDYKVPLWQVAMATSAAPSYLPSFVLPQDRIRLIDGGVWANNPVVVGIAEATSLLGAPLDSVRVLSLGTSSEVKHRNKRLNNGGLIQWARGSTVVDVLLRGQSIGANGLAQHLVGPEDVLRIDPVVPANVLKLDSADSDRLISMAASNSRIESPLFFDRFTDHVAPAFEPHYSTTDTHRG